MYIQIAVFLFKRECNACADCKSGKINEKINMEEKLPVVDEVGNVIGSASRKDCHSGLKILHPVVHLHVFDKSGRLFLQLRSPKKLIQPNKWDTSVGGHVDFGETVEQALRREAFEEIGLSVKSEKHLFSYIFESSIEKELVNAFSAIAEENEIKIEPQEISEGRFFSFEEIENMIGKNLLTPNFEMEFEKLKEAIRNKQ